MTPAVTAAKQAKIAYTLHEYTHDPANTAYGLEAAEALGLEPERVFKTLIAQLDSGRLVAALVPVSATLNLKVLAEACGVKRAVMAAVAAAERSSGYVAGGISPLGQRKRLTTVVDDSALDHPTIFVSGGRRGLEIELAPDDLIELCSARAAAIAR